MKRTYVYCKHFVNAVNAVEAIWTYREAAWSTTYASIPKTFLRVCMTCTEYEWNIRFWCAYFWTTVQRRAQSYSVYTVHGEIFNCRYSTNIFKEWTSIYFINSSIKYLFAISKQECLKYRYSLRSEMQYFILQHLSDMTF